MPDRDERVDAALAEYLAACDACDPPQRAAFLARFPDLADSLAAFLDDHERRALRPAVENRSTSAFRPATTTPASRYPEIVAEDLPGYAPELNPDELVWC